MESTRAHLHVIGLEYDAPAISPKTLKRKYETLKRIYF